MQREDARQEIRRNWKRLFPTDRKNKGIICPLCNSGSGEHGTGITENPRKPGQLKCWNCGFQGDVIDLIQQARGTDYNTALKEAAADLGISIDYYRQNGSERRDAQKALNSGGEGANVQKPVKEDRGAQESAQKATDAKNREPAADISTDYSQYYMQCEDNIFEPAAVSYLQARGISLETALYCGLGYDPAWISQTVRKNQRAKGSVWLPEPTERIIIPVTENHYIARAISPDVKREFAKMNETGGGKTGIFNAGAVYEDQEAVFVTEGAFDALSIIETGAAALALNSTSNINLFLKQLEAEPTRATLVLCLDNDKAGEKAAAELQRGLTRLNVSYITADICGGYKDPNEALTGNRAAFVNAILDAQAQAAARPDNMRAYIDNLMQGEIERLKAAADRKTGFEKLDEKSGGIYPGLYVIAATSSLGKTTLALQIADNLAEAGHDVLFFSLEQSRLELVSKSFTRMLAQENRGDDKSISSLALRKGYYSDRRTAAAGLYKERIADRMSIIEGNFNCNISFIGDYIRRYIKRNGTSPIVFIDYLQILQPADDARSMSAKETVDSTVTELKRISREHDLTVFVISSVNRANYLAPIDFEALKESGGIEYTADVIWGLQLQCLNDDLFSNPNTKIKEKRQKIREEKAANPRKIELLCLKNRYGIANFSCGFNYYPALDLYTQANKEDFYQSYGEDAFTSDQDTKEGEFGNNAEITASF